MSIKGSMFSGIAGLNSHAMAMSVIGNNLANTNTYGYKSQRADFQDIFYSTVNTGGGTGQIGHGSSVAAIMTNFQQGPYQQTGSPTDVAIGGKGFFQVRDKNNPDRMLYTRAGNFVFNRNGVLVDPNGNVVQGWKSEPGKSDGIAKAQGSPVDIKLDQFQSPPQATSKLAMRLNLNSDSADKSPSTTNPFFSMFSQWNGTKTPPLATTKYSYQSTVKVYDANGGAHDLTVSFDRVGDPVTSTAGGMITWEFTVTVPPTDDGRTINGIKLKGTSAAGMLMTGTMTMDPSGALKGMTAFTLASNASGNLRGLNNWVPAKLSANGMPQVSANFLGQADANLVTDSKAKPIEIDLGIKNKATSGTGWNSKMQSNAAAVGNTYSSLANMDEVEVGASSVTSHKSPNSTFSRTQDGFAAGFLQNVSINADGLVSGRYSNGQILDLYVLTLAKFANQSGLQRLGNNLYAHTRESGLAVTGVANTGGLGKINSNSLEQSNVDPGKEMVRLITTQRGFQANSKVITTSDQMLAELIALKR